MRLWPLVLTLGLAPFALGADVAHAQSFGGWGMAHVDQAGGPVTALDAADGGWWVSVGPRVVWWDGSDSGATGPNQAGPEGVSDDLGDLVMAIAGDSEGAVAQLASRRLVALTRTGDRIIAGGSVDLTDAGPVHGLAWLDAHDVVLVVVGGELRAYQAPGLEHLATVLSARADPVVVGDTIAVGAQDGGVDLYRFAAPGTLTASGSAPGPAMDALVVVESESGGVPQLVGKGSAGGESVMVGYGLQDPDGGPTELWRHPVARGAGLGGGSGAAMAFWPFSGQVATYDPTTGLEWGRRGVDRPTAGYVAGDAVLVGTYSGVLRLSPVMTLADAEADRLGALAATAIDMRGQEAVAVDGTSLVRVAATDDLAVGRATGRPGQVAGVGVDADAGLRSVAWDASSGWAHAASGSTGLVGFDVQGTAVAHKPVSTLGEPVLLADASDGMVVGAGPGLMWRLTLDPEGASYNLTDTTQPVERPWSIAAYQDALSLMAWGELGVAAFDFRDASTHDVLMGSTYAVSADGALGVAGVGNDIVVLDLGRDVPRQVGRQGALSVPIATIDLEGDRAVVSSESQIAVFQVSLTGPPRRLAWAVDVGPVVAAAVDGDRVISAAPATGLRLWHVTGAPPATTIFLPWSEMP